MENIGQFLENNGKWASNLGYFNFIRKNIDLKC